jgi:hypothetical protein
MNVIDLANINSCSFIADFKKLTTLFEVLGRFDNSDIRGCNVIGFITQLNNYKIVSFRFEAIQIDC